MKMKSKILLALTVAAVTSVGGLNNGLASPRTDQFLDEHKTSGLPPGDQIDRSRFGNARGWQIIDEGTTYVGPSTDQMLDREVMNHPRQREAHNMKTASTAVSYEEFETESYPVYESEETLPPAYESEDFEPYPEYQPDEPEDMEELDDLDYDSDDDYEEFPDGL